MRCRPLRHRKRRIAIQLSSRRSCGAPPERRRAIHCCGAYDAATSPLLPIAKYAQPTVPNR